MCTIYDHAYAVLLTVSRSPHDMLDDQQVSVGTWANVGRMQAVLTYLSDFGPLDFTHILQETGSMSTLDIRFEKFLIHKLHMKC